jgi:hypothetical protein
MPLQNRVDPFGQIHAVAARGLFTGNRGVIHDPATRTLLSRRWTTKAWIICVCVYGDRRRDVMGRNAPSGNAGWTELFFLDEVTALAAGHRPCFFCRREQATAFADCFGRARSTARPKVAEIDAVLHRERLARGGEAMALAQGEVADLPDGAMMAAGGAAYVMRQGMALRWSFEGYRDAVPLSDLAADITLVTPPSTVAALRAGYAPVWWPVISGLTVG